MGLKSGCCIHGHVEVGHSASIQGAGTRGEVCRRAEQIIAAARSDPNFDLEVGEGFLEGLEAFAYSSLTVLGIALMFPWEQRD